MAIGSDLEQWRNGVKAFETLSVLLSTDAMLAGEEPTQVRVACVSAGVTPLFGVSPVMGRDFRPEEFEHAPAAPGLRPSDQNRKDTGIAILTERLFRKLGSDATLLGKPVVIAGTPYTVVGVMPSTFRLPVAPSLQLGVGSQDDVDVVLNTTIGPTSRVPGAVLGRLAPGAALETATAELQGIRAAANQTRSEDERTSDLALQVVRLDEQIVARSKRVLLVLWASVGFVLVVACVNIIALLLSRVRRATSGDGDSRRPRRQPLADPQADADREHAAGLCRRRARPGNRLRDRWAARQLSGRGRSAAAGCGAQHDRADIQRRRLHRGRPAAQRCAGDCVAGEYRESIESDRRIHSELRSCASVAKRAGRVRARVYRHSPGGRWPHVAKLEPGAVGGRNRETS